MICSCVAYSSKALGEILSDSFHCRLSPGVFSFSGRQCYDLFMSTEGSSHFSLEREPEVTISPGVFEKVVGAIQLAERLAGVLKGERAVAAADAHYTVSHIDGPGRLESISISWTEKNEFIIINVRNDYGPERNSVAGTKMRKAEFGGPIQGSPLSEAELVEQFDRIDNLICQGRFVAQEPTRRFR